MRFKVLLAVCVAVEYAPALAFADWADWQQFIPRPLANGVYVDTYTSFEQDNNRSGGSPVRWHDTFFREKLTFYSDGYSYHPRFLRYHFSITGAEKQEDYESSFLPTLGWQYGSGVEYDARIVLLPEHPYNLRLYATRYEPLFKEQTATQHNAVETSRGASFRYRKKPYFMHASYGEDSVDSADVSSDIQRAYVDGEYFKRYKSGNELSFRGAFNPSWFNNSQGLDGNSYEYLVANFVNLKRVRLTSSLSKDTFDQETLAPGGFKFSNDQLAWYELLTGYLPWNFRTDLSYRYQDNNSTTESTGAPSTDLSDKDRNLQFDLVHRLYQSVDTTYTLLHDDRTSSGGDTTALSNSLTINYTKAIPSGRILAGISGSRTDTDNHGQVDVVNESDASVVPGSFTLRQQNVEMQSIDVFLLVCLVPVTSIDQCPSPPARVLLEEGINYTTQQVGNSVTIAVTAVPPEYLVPDVTHVYPFLVSYSLLGGDFSLRTDAFGANTSVQLLDDLLTPYFGYLALRSDVLSGTFLGIPVDSTTYTTGLIVHRGPVRARAEYQELDWQVSPYQAWRAELQYSAALTATTNLYATTAYLNKHYPQGTSPGNPVAFNEESESVAGSIQKLFPAQNLSAGAGGSFSHLQGLIDSNGYSANASLTWKIGKVDLSLGASVYGADTSGTAAGSTHRDHQLFYLKVRRQIF